MRLSEVLAKLHELEAKLGDVFVENGEGILVEITEGRDERGEPVVVIE